MISVVIMTGLTRARAAQVRLSTIAQIKGAQDNQLVGYGLVVGLQRTGDTQLMYPTLESISNMLSRFGVTVSPEELKTENVASVMVTALLPPMLHTGTKIDVTVSAIGDAMSLKGGTLLMTPLEGPDGVVYAVAQGSLLTSGYSHDSNEFPIVQFNETNVGRIPDGGIVVRSVPASFDVNNQIAVLLDQPGFSQASIVEQSINRQFGANTAKAVDGDEIDVQVPYNYQNNIVDFIAAVKNIPVFTDSPANRVVVDERTGTIVIGADVQVDPVAIAHGNLRLVIQKTTQLTHTAYFGYNQLSNTTTLKVTNTGKKGNLIVLPAGTNIVNIVNAINAVGGTPQDVIAILEAIKAAGALHAQLKII